MDNLLDYNPEEVKNENVLYATFWNRTVASLLDMLVLIFIAPLSIYNLIEWKSMPLWIVLSTLAVLYKPVMEYIYKATLGKMAMKLVVTDYDLQAPNLQQVILRNIFNIMSSVVSFFITLNMFNHPDFLNVTTYTQYQTFILANSSNVNNIVSLIIIIDVLSMFYDKHNRTLHDKIGKTLVVKKDSL